jgi:hypothetical protein
VRISARMCFGEFMTRDDEIMAELRAIRAQLSALLAALAEDDSDPELEAFTLDGERMPGARDPNQPL